MMSTENIVGLYFIENENDFRVTARLVKYIDSVLKHSPKLLMSREMIQDLAMQTSLYADVVIESEIIKLYDEESYTKMSKEDIEIASIKIPNIISFNRDMKISEILE